mmetsp:Transcript_5290/g.15181  ORF Transcript_5290/g.15181 Transcript_5290/m.15181 type:complete len:92 (-) Transcript_5290:413-688(-)
MERSAAAPPSNLQAWEDRPSSLDNEVIPQRRNPLVIVGCGITVGVLAAGLIAFKQGNSALSQKMMRYRVMAQAGTVALMVGSSAYASLTTP